MTLDLVGDIKGNNVTLNQGTGKGVLNEAQRRIAEAIGPRLEQKLIGNTIQIQITGVLGVLMIYLLYVPTEVELF